MQRRKGILVLGGSMVALSGALPSAWGEVRRVDHDASAGGNGQTWATAYKYLRDAIAAASSGDEIWVAEGVYKPTERSCANNGNCTGNSTGTCSSGVCSWEEPRFESFYLPSGVAIYGGFDGTETCRDQRDFVSNLTILNGDLDGDDIPEGHEAPICPPDPFDGLLDDNSCSVVRADQTDPTSTILDGVTISGGNSIGDCDEGGGGIRLTGTDGEGARFWNCRIVCNATDHDGGGIFSPLLSACTVWVVDSVVAKNVANDPEQHAGHGGGIGLTKGFLDFVMFNSQVVENIASDGGGGVFLYGAYGANGEVIVNSVIAFNQIDPSAEGSEGGGLTVSGSTKLAISNSTISMNNAGAGKGGGIYIGNASVDITNSIVWGNLSDGDGHQILVGGETGDINTGVYSDFAEGTHDIDGSSTPLSHFVGSWDHVITDNPEFNDADNGDFSLKSISPVIDVASNDALFDDLVDLNDNGVTTGEKVPFDLAGLPRQMDDPDVGGATAPIVDMGAYEFNACPSGTLVASNPPDGVVDARQPHAVNSATPRQGIDTLTVTAPAGAAKGCFYLCETKTFDDTPIAISSMSASSTTYTLTLNRVITPGAVTTLRYAGDPTTELEYTFHPGNVNGDSKTDMADIFSLIHCLRGEETGTNCPWSYPYSEDINQSEAFTGADILRVVDLFNGADEFDVWGATSLPVGLHCTGAGDCPTPDGSPGCTVVAKWTGPTLAPVAGTDYVVSTSGGLQSVTLKTTVKESVAVTGWKIGCMNGSKAGDIGTISTDWQSPSNQNITVEVGTTSDTKCRNVTSVDIARQSSSKYSNVKLDLEGGVLEEAKCYADNSNNGGRLSGTVSGPAKGVSGKSVGTGATTVGDLEFESSTGDISLGTVAADSTITAAILLDELLIDGDLEGDLDIGMIWYADGEDSPKGGVHVTGNGASTCRINTGVHAPEVGLVGGKILIDGDFAGIMDIVKMTNDEMDTPHEAPAITIGNDFNGAISIENSLEGTLDIGGGMYGVVGVYGAEIGVGGDLNGEISIVGDLAGNFYVAGTIAGDLTVGGNFSGEIITIDDDISGTVIITGDAGGYIYVTGDITGDFAIGGEFNGDLCANNITSGQPLPENITVTFGRYGLICGYVPECLDNGDCDTSYSCVRYACVHD